MASQPLCWTADFTHTISFFRFLQPHIFCLLKQDGGGEREEKLFLFSTGSHRAALNFNF